MGRQMRHAAQSGPTEPDEVAQPALLGPVAARAWGSVISLEPDGGQCVSFDAVLADHGHVAFSPPPPLLPEPAAADLVPTDLVSTDLAPRDLPPRDLAPRDLVLADFWPAPFSPIEPSTTGPSAPELAASRSRTGARGPGAHVRSGPAPAELPVEPVSQHAWMGPDGLIIPMPGRDEPRPSGTL